MNSVQTIVKLNKEIEEFITNQREVLRSYERDRRTLDPMSKQLVETLYYNLKKFENEKDLILGLRELTK